MIFFMLICSRKVLTLICVLSLTVQNMHNYIYTYGESYLNLESEIDAVSQWCTRSI